MSACSGCDSKLWQETKFCAECGTKVTSSPTVEQITSARPASSPKQISFALIRADCEEPKIIPEVPPPPPKRKVATTLVGAHRKATPMRQKSNSQPNLSVNSSSIVSSAVSLPNVKNRALPPPPLPPPLSTKPRYSHAQPKLLHHGSVPISPRIFTATNTEPLIPSNTSNTVAKQQQVDEFTVPSSEHEVILVRSTYNAETPPPVTRKPVPPCPIRKATSSPLLLMCSIKRKRMSFNTVVAMAVGHDGSEYQANIVGYENRIENIDSTLHTATLYKIEVHKDNQTWFVYRRYGQFSKLARKLREKKLLSSIGLKANFPLKKLDVQQSLLALDKYLNTLLSRSEVASSHYISNFLQPLQLGDSKPQNC